MSDFIKYYTNSTNGLYVFTKLVRTTDPNVNYILGGDSLVGFYNFGSAGLTKVDAQGNVIFCKEYGITGFSYLFTDGVVADNGDILITGIKKDQPNIGPGEKIVMRIQSNGILVWSQVYSSVNVSELSLGNGGPKIIKSTGDKYFLMHCNGSNATTIIQKIDGAGSIIKSKQIDDVIGEDLVLDNTGCVIVGTSVINAYGGGIISRLTIIKFDTSLNITNSQVITPNPSTDFFQERVNVVRIDSDRYLALSYYRTPSSYYTVLLEINLITNHASGYRMQFPSSLNPGGVLMIGNHYYTIHQKHYMPFDHVITKYDLSLNRIWEKHFSPPASISPEDFLAFPGVSELLFAGIDGSYSRGILIRTDLELDTCLTHYLTPSVRLPMTLPVQSFTPTVSNFPVTPTDIASLLTITDLSLNTQDGCNCGGVILDSTASYQSPYIYLQTTGSDGSDQTVRGYHLRWDLRKYLGDIHLPKGNLAATGASYATTIGFNRADDFVKIYKAPYGVTYPVTANLTIPPTSILESGQTRKWTYGNLTPIAGLPTYTTDIFLKFTDIGQYDYWRTLIDPNFFPYNFLTNYKGGIEVGAVNKLAFKVTIIFAFIGASNPVNVRAESVSLTDKTDPASRIISCRTLVNTHTPLPPFHCEDIEYIRFDYSGAIPSFIEIETYQDFIKGAEENCAWTDVGEFSLDDGLSDNNSAVFKQLEDSPTWLINGLWPKYNETTPAGEFKVKTQNYKDKWTLTADGLQKAVIDYLDLSRTDLDAIRTLPNNDPVVNSSTLEVSYLDLLNLISLDYHTARMLGLGFIHSNATATPSDQFVYLMEYITEAPLTPGSGGLPGFVRHYYMAPPVSISNAKLPPVPNVITTPVYGIEMDVLSGTMSPITDTGGYAPYDDIRFVNLHRNLFDYERPFEAFFATTNLFCLCDKTVPVMFGVEYRDDLAGPGNYVSPEILNDPNYEDPAGLPETTTVFETGKNPVFTHLERNEGIHHYAIYSINWFSRPSAISVEISTDLTEFTKKNLLLPPSNFNVQLIQEETPRIFTTGFEQGRLTAISGTDKTLVRATFDWNHVQNANYQVADKIELFFRKEGLKVVKGKIMTGVGAITLIPGTHRIKVKTQSYLIASTSPPTTVQPNIGTPDINKFLGGVFVANGKSFVIQNIYPPSSGNDPVFELEQIKFTESIDPDHDNIFTTIETYESPGEGEMFFVVENLNNATTWDSQLLKEVSIKNFLPVYTETVIYADGSSETFNYGGLSDTATIEHIMEPPGGFPPNTPSGTYTIEFDTSNLISYDVEFGDPDVEYYQGRIRIPVFSSTQKKTLQVIGIDNSGPTLILVAFDPDHLTDPVIPNLPGTYSGISVNFHPSYRAYFYKDTTGTNNFEESNIIPASGDGSRETYMAARSKDTILGYVSSMTLPALILAQELREPVPPGQPLGPLFATRPNFYGKSTYTFDVQIDQPFSLIFYKANERRILETLYKPETVNTILADMEAMSTVDAGFFTNRWSDLANMVTDSAFLFPEYVPGGFRFPIPDNETFAIPYSPPSAPIYPFLSGTIPPGSNSIVAGTLQTMHEVVKDAIDGAFLPLTEQPVIYLQIQDTEFLTSGRPPKLRDTNGDRLTTEDSTYDPSPMCCRYEKDIFGTILLAGDSGYGTPGNTRFVRFTDYTLDGASIHNYFYFAAELSNKMKVSDRSIVTGPIKLVNSYPAEMPSVKKVTSNLANSLLSTPVSVSFEVEPFIKSEHITKISIYRSTELHDELSVRTMVLANTIDVGLPLIDDFSGLTFPPFGDPIFYRLVALREITNEQGLTEFIPSKPSNPVLATIVDNINPPAPSINYNSDPPTPPPVILNNVELFWAPTCYNGTYYLFKQMSSGNWMKIWETSSNAATISVLLSATDYGSGSLEKEDSDGNTIYHRFKVTAENASGLLNLTENELTI